jgi:hypothetical protein
LLQLAAPAFGFAEVHADIPEHGREGDLLPDDRYSFRALALTDETDIAGNIYAGGTGVLTR